MIYARRRLIALAVFWLCFSFFFFSRSLCFPALLVSISLMPLFILPFLPCRSALMALLWRRISHANSRQFVRESSRTFFPGCISKHCGVVVFDLSRCAPVFRWQRAGRRDRQKLNSCSAFFFCFPCRIRFVDFLPPPGQKQLDARVKTTR